MVFTWCHSKHETILPPTLPKESATSSTHSRRRDINGGNSPRTRGYITQEISSPNTSTDGNYILTHKQLLN